MKKVWKCLLLLLVVYVLIPVVHAADLPKTGVTYFMEYPNGRFDATVSYQEAIDPDEVLIHSDVTDKNGEIQLCDWNREGEIRVLQHVPNGYTTNQRETTIDLSSTTQFGFIDYRGANPGTGRSLLFIVIVASVIAITIAARRNKKVLMVLPIVGLIAAFNIHANAKDDCLCIQVKDGNGNALSNVAVDIYSKPKVTANVGIKFNANGGHFFDGTTELYFPIPFDGCTFDDFLNELSPELRSYYEDNVASGAYREGFEPDGFDAPADLHNGDEIFLDWYETDDPLFEIRGNGGYYPFYGKQLDHVFYYDFDDTHFFATQFVKRNEYYIGFDEYSTCPLYENGVIRDLDAYYEMIGKNNDMGNFPLRRIEGIDGIGSSIQTYYDCWSGRPDGIYVNDTVFIGNTNSCFATSALYIPDHHAALFFSQDHYQSITFVLDPDTNQLIVSPVVSRDIPDVEKDGNNTFRRMEFDEAIAKGGYDIGQIALPMRYEDIESFEIVQNGQVILTLNPDDFVPTTYHETDAFQIADPAKAQALLDFIDSLGTETCQEMMHSGLSGGGFPGDYEQRK